MKITKKVIPSILFSLLFSFNFLSISCMKSSFEEEIFGQEINLPTETIPLHDYINEDEENLVDIRYLGYGIIALHVVRPTKKFNAIKILNLHTLQTWTIQVKNIQELECSYCMINNCELIFLKHEKNKIWSFHINLRKNKSINLHEAPQKCIENCVPSLTRYIEFCNLFPITKNKILLINSCTRFNDKFYVIDLITQKITSLNLYFSGRNCNNFTYDENIKMIEKHVTNKSYFYDPQDFLYEANPQPKTIISRQKKIIFSLNRRHAYIPNLNKIALLDYNHQTNQTKFYFRDVTEDLLLSQSPAFSFCNRTKICKFLMLDPTYDRHPNNSYHLRNKRLNYNNNKIILISRVWHGINDLNDITITIINISSLLENRYDHLSESLLKLI